MMMKQLYLMQNNIAPDRGGLLLDKPGRWSLEGGGYCPTVLRAAGSRGKEVGREKKAAEWMWIGSGVSSGYPSSLWEALSENNLKASYNICCCSVFEC